MTTDCASVMFSYINIYGKYPPGLFANQCKEGKEGLDCSQVKPANSSDPSNSGPVAAPHSILLMTTAGFLGFLFHLLWRLKMWKTSCINWINISRTVILKHFEWGSSFHLMLEFIFYDQDFPEKYIITVFSFSWLLQTVFSCLASSRLEWQPL